MAKSATNKKKKSTKDLQISRYKDPRSRPGLYYGTDGLKKIRLPNGEIRWVEKDVHPTRT